MQWQSALSLLQKSHEALTAENRTLKNELKSLNHKLSIFKRKNEILNHLSKKYTTKYKQIAIKIEKLELHCSYNQNDKLKLEASESMNEELHQEILHMHQQIDKLRDDNRTLYGIYHEYIKRHDTDRENQVKLQQINSEHQSELNRAYSKLLDAKATINELYTVIAKLQQEVDNKSSPPSNDTLDACSSLIHDDTNMLSLYTSYTQRHLSESVLTMAESNGVSADTKEPRIVKESCSETKEDAKNSEPTIIIYSDDSESGYTNNETLFLANRGYKRGEKTSRVLQGFVYEVESNKTGFKYLAKQVDKHLNSKHLTMENEKTFANVLNEKCILESITKQNAPLFVVNFIDWFESDRYYYLIMEYGKSNLFDFVVEAHEYIASGSLLIKEWRKFVKYIFWQMSVLFLWLHNIANVTHLDISPENILLQNAKFVQRDDDKLSISNDIVIKVYGFDFAQFHDIGAHNVYQGGFMSTKGCDKSNGNYKSPQVYSGDGEFDARKADVWSLGVVLFCMAVGNAPFREPSAEDEYYGNFIEKGHLAQLLYGWRRHHYVTQKLLSLMKHMLTHKEDKRYLMDDVIQHPWLRIYYTKNYEMVKSDLLNTIFHGSKVKET